MSTKPGADPTAVASGPGLAPYWGGNGDGQYILTVRGIGNGLFTWSRSKLINDGNGKYDWFAYRRKGDAQPFDITGPNAFVETLRIQNFPFDSVEPNLVNWNEWSPASNFTGDCGSPMNVGVSVLGASVGTTFQDCDRYSMWRNANKPSSYWLEMDQGYVLRHGNREAAYALAWKQKQGTAASQHDLQKLVFHYNGNAYTCKHTDAGDTC